MGLRSTRKRRQRERERERAEAPGGARAAFAGGCQFVVGSVREMSQEDLRAQIPEAELAAIREQDPHPLFVAIDVAQEGESTGHMVVNGQDVGRQKKLWSAGAIKEFAQKLKSAVVRGLAPFWHGDHGNKTEVGRILGSFVKKVGEATHAIAIGWVFGAHAKEAFRNGEVDTGSMEADCQFERSGDSWLVRAVNAVQGIVLAGKGKGTEPGFAGAAVLATVQELTKEGADMEGETPLTLRDVQDIIRDNAWVPSQVFGKQPLLEDRVVADALVGEVKTEVEKAVAERDKAIKELEGDAKAHRSHVAQQEAVKLIDKSEKLKDATRGTVAYLKKVLKLDLSGVPVEERQTKVDTAVDEQLAIITETGIKIPEPSDGKDSETQPDPSDEPEPPETAAPGTVVFKGKDMTDPKHNPQIPGPRG